MGKILKFTKPAGDSEFDHMMIGFYEAIEKLVPVNRPGIITVELTEQGLVLTPVAPRGGAGASGAWHLGEYNSTTAYAAQKQVTRGTLGEFVSMQAVPEGVLPESGAPYWHGLTWASPGVWS